MSAEVKKQIELVGVGAASQRLIPTRRSSLLLTRIAATKSVLLCVRMKSWRLGFSGTWFGDQASWTLIANTRKKSASADLNARIQFFS